MKIEFDSGLKVEFVDTEDGIQWRVLLDEFMRALNAFGYIVPNNLEQLIQGEKDA